MKSSAVRKTTKVLQQKKTYAEFGSAAIYGLSGIIAGLVFPRLSFLGSLGTFGYAMATKNQKLVYTSIGFMSGIPVLGSRSGDAVSMARYTDVSFYQNALTNAFDNLKDTAKGFARGAFIDLILPETTKASFGLQGIDSRMTRQGQLPMGRLRGTRSLGSTPKQVRLPLSSGNPRPSTGTVKMPLSGYNSNKLISAA